MVTTFILAVGILRLPRLAREAFAVGALQINLGDGYAVVGTLGRETLDGEIATLGGLAKLDGLPAIASLESTCADWRSAVEVGLVADVIVLVALLKLQLVELRLSLSPDYSLLRTNHVEHNYLVLTFLQPAARHVERLLRTDAPDAAHGMTVHIHLSLAPC